MMSSNFKWLWLFVFLKISAANVNICHHSEQLRNCNCGNVIVEKQTYVTVNCTNQGFTNVDMLQELPEDTQMVIFIGNHIPVLPSNIFGDMDLSDLRVIDMTGNGIREIKGKAFHHVGNVERLILNHNNLSIANEDDANMHHSRMFSNFYNLAELHLSNAFADNTGESLASDLHDIFVNSNLTKLYKLHLEQNEIKYFKDPKVFCDLPNLHDIYLGDNFIPSLNFNITCLKKLRYLDLEKNNISKFSQKDLDIFDKLAKPFRNDTNLLINIAGNPFRCDHAIKNLYDWLHNTNVDIRNKDNLECHQSKFGHKHIMNLKNLAEAKKERFSQAVLVLTWVGVIVLVTLLVGYIYMKKDKFNGHFSPFLQTITRKVHYRTIESQDV